jgi:hypothetical protein
VAKIYLNNSLRQKKGKEKIPPVFLLNLIFTFLTTLQTAYAILAASRFGSCLCFSSSHAYGAVAATGAPAGGPRRRRWGRRGFLAAVGVLINVLAVAAGLGLAALIGISFNATSTQVRPHNSTRKSAAVLDRSSPYM